MTLDDVIARVRSVFGDVSGTQLINEDLAKWATDAQLDVVRETKCSQTSTSVSLVSDQYEYTILASLTISLVTVDGEAIRGISRQELNQRYPNRHSAEVSKGRPEFFYAFSNASGTVISLFPTPDSSSAGLALRVEHNVRPAPLVNLTDNLSIPDQYVDIVVDRCLKRAYQWDGQLNAARASSDDAQGKMVDARAESEQPSDDSYPAVRCLPGDLGGWYG